MKSKTKQLNPKKKYIFFGIIPGILLALFGWWAYGNLRSYPLGDRMEYLGKQDLGGGLFFSDSRPYSEYYYGTDMTAEEVVRYFKGARIDDASELEGVQESGGSPRLFLTYKKSAESFVVTYYNVTHQDHAYIPPHIQWGSKKHVIQVTSSGYEIAKKSLNNQ